MTNPRVLATLVCAAMLAAPLSAIASPSLDEVSGVPEVAISRVAPATDGTHATISPSAPNGICYIWEQAEIFSPGVSVATFGTNTKGIAADAPGAWAYNAAYDQCSADAGSIWDAWAPGENAVMIYEVFNDQSTTGRNYTMIYEDQMEGDGSTNFGGGGTPVAPNILTPINDPYLISYDGMACVIGIPPQTTGFEVLALFDGYGVWKSTVGPITQSNQGTFLGDAALDGGVWKYTDASAVAQSWYAVRVKWNGGTHPFYAPRYSYGMSNDLYTDNVHWPSGATGPMGSSTSANVTITYNPDCGCFGWTHIYYSNDRNATWHYIGTEEDEWNEDGVCSWTAPGSGEYWWLATNDYPENDDPPVPGTPAEAGPYVITLPVPTFGIPVVSGWNLVSFPVMATGSPPTVLDDMGGDTAWSVVKWYDPQDPADPWKSYRIGGTANDLAGVSNLMGFWIHITNPGSDGKLVVDGANPGNTTINLHAGWNLVGYPSMDNETAANALWGTGADRVEVCNMSAPGLISPVGPTYVMHAGEGYWVHVNADAVWSIGNGFTAPQPYTIYGSVYLYDGTYAEGYDPMPSAAKARVTVTWWDTVGARRSAFADTDLAGRYSYDIFDYKDGGMVYLNSTFEEPYGNKGYNFTTIREVLGASYQNVVCGIPYRVSITTPNAPPPYFQAIPGVSFVATYSIYDIDGKLARGYFTHSDGPMTWSAGDPLFLPPSPGYFDGTSSPSPAQGTNTLTLFTANYQSIVIAEGGIGETNPYLTPWGAFYLDPSGQQPGWSNDQASVQIVVL